MKNITQEERLDYLVEAFKTDSGNIRISKRQKMQKVKREF